MPQTPREIVIRCLTFQTPERMPRDMWMLPWAANRFPEEAKALQRDYPGDFAGPPAVYRPSKRLQGDPYVTGKYTDDWGCVFHNIQEGVHGEVKEPIIPDISDWRSCKPPYETLPEDPDRARGTVNRFCAESGHFVMAGCCPRPWERYQFLRGTENAMVDVLMPETGGGDLLKRIHEFYLREIEFWVSTDVDAISFMDDWGAQRQLLIPPPIWRDLFKPLYKDYCGLAHSNGKFVFMHSDGYISDVYDDVVEVGVNALNSQLFTMDMADLARRVKGRITFWGEIDRQHVLPSRDPEEVRAAVRQVARHLYDPRGGIIAQFEFGAGAQGANPRIIFEEWDRVQKEAGVLSRGPNQKPWQPAGWS